MGRGLKSALYAQHNPVLKKRACEYMEQYSSQPIDHSALVSSNTKKERDRLWAMWMEVCQDDLHIDSETAWVSFLKHPGNPKYQAPFQSFLTSYVENTKKWTLTLDSCERRLQRTLNSVYSVVEVWRRLVAWADHHVMLPRRRVEPAEGRFWRLRHSIKDEGVVEGPAFFMVKWIHNYLAPNLGLELSPTYVKVAMTETDVQVVLQTLWERAADIPCTPVARVSFHAVILLGSIGGFRPGTLINLPYRQFEVSIVRDPTHPAKKKIVCTVWIMRNKKNELSKLCRPNKSDWICFSITVIPNSMLCLATIILARAVQDNAFEANYKTIDEIFDQPNLGNVDYVSLKWKKDAFDKTIFPISYAVLYMLWVRVLIVAGYRIIFRLYSLRVGTGGRLDGVLSNCLRNYILSHSTEVFEKSYQTHHIHVDLVRLAFGENAGQDDAAFFKSIRNTSMTRDANAPIYIMEEERLAFEQRRDVTEYRSRIEETTDTSARRRLQSELYSLLKTLENLLLEKKRKEHFDRTDYLRSRGLDTVDSHGLEGPSMPIDEKALAVAKAMRADRPSRLDPAIISQRNARFIQDYLSSTATERRRKERVQQGQYKARGATNSQCLLCQRHFARRETLTKHFKERHTQTTFNRPFPCPECRRLGRPDALVSTPSEWSNHAEKEHGRANTPNLPPGSAAALPCSICPSQCSTPESLIRHMNRHVKARWEVAYCRLCPRIKFSNLWQWLDHCRTHVPTIMVCLVCGNLCSSTAGLTKHMNSAHKNYFQNNRPCPACERLGSNYGTRYDDLSTWLPHAGALHPVWSSIANPEKTTDEHDTQPAISTAGSPHMLGGYPCDSHSMSAHNRVDQLERDYTPISTPASMASTEESASDCLPIFSESFSEGVDEPMDLDHPDPASPPCGGDDGRSQSPLLCVAGPSESDIFSSATRSPHQFPTHLIDPTLKGPSEPGPLTGIINHLQDPGLTSSDNQSARIEPDSAHLQLRDNVSRAEYSSPEDVIPRLEQGPTSTNGERVEESTPGSGAEHPSHNTYIVDKIVNHRGPKRKRQYRVCWVGYDDRTWEPRSHFADEALVDIYEESLSRRKKRRRIG